MAKQEDNKEENKNHLFDLYDNLLRDVYEKQLQSNLKNFIEGQKIYNQIVQRQKQKIDEQLHQRRKTLQAKSRIHKSSLINRHHMMKAELRFKMCQEVFTAVLQKIKHKLQQDQQQHCLILIKLIVEGALRMFEPELQIRCLPKHFDIVERVIQASEQTFNAIMIQQTGRGYPIKIKINKLDTLEERDIAEKQKMQKFSKKREERECIGGVILSDLSGNITYKNTIDTRINILKEISLPIMRATLWPNMKSQVQNGQVL